jgi:hypothetical protein
MMGIADPSSSSIPEHSSSVAIAPDPHVGIIPHSADYSETKAQTHAATKSATPKGGRFSF